MHDDLDLRVIERHHDADPRYREALRQRVAAILDGSEAPPTEDAAPEAAMIDLVAHEVVSSERHRRRWVASAAALIGAAAVIAGIFVVRSSDDTRSPADQVESPLEEPSRDEVAAATNTGVYEPGNGPTEVTAGRSYVSLRRCEIRRPPYYEDRRPCDGPDGWAYATGSADAPGVHHGLLGSGLLGTADDLVLSALDDRLFVASTASLAQDPPSAPLAWLIDSVTGQRGQLTWRDEPTTLNAPEQVLVLSGRHFLPRVVDRRDWTLRPLSVPEDATAALAIHQPGSGRIWIGTAPEGGHVGLAYTDDGGATWTDVELPSPVRPTSAELVASQAPGSDDLLVVAATGDHVAVTDAWGGATKVFVSADAGETWNTVGLDPADGNGRKLYVLSDGRLMVVLSVDNYARGVLVSTSASDWSHLEGSDYSGFQSGFLAASDSTVDVDQHGLVVHYDRDLCDGEGLVPSVSFSTDLTDWWTIPGLDFLSRC
jgi:hypothetical protein